MLQWYEWLEEQLLEVTAVIPLSDVTWNVYSPRLATIITESCALLDAVFRNSASIVTFVGDKVVYSSQLTITHYASIFSKRYNLPRLKSILLIPLPRYLTPFSEWELLLTGGTYKPLPWWRTFTSLKHNKISHLSKATFKEAVNSLCALHQVISVLPEYSRAILRRGWIPGSRLNPELLVKELETGSNPSHSVLVETSLFVLARGKEEFPNNIGDFRPAFFDASKRISDFFGRWY